jgi:hypothetical protein
VDGLPIFTQSLAMCAEKINITKRNPLNMSTFIRVIKLNIAENALESQEK